MLVMHNKFKEKSRKELKKKTYHNVGLPSLNVEKLRLQPLFLASSLQLPNSVLPANTLHLSTHPRCTQGK